MIVGEMRIIPVGAGSSMDEPLEKVVERLENLGIEHEVGPMGTTIQSDNLDDLFNAVKECHRALMGDVPRIVTTFTVDHRMDKEETRETLSRV